jgi:hypothetical protein
MVDDANARERALEQKRLLNQQAKRSIDNLGLTTLNPEFL